MFLDAADIKYQYEPEGFVLSNGTYYLPDFYLPDLKMWVEIKATMTPEDKEKIKEFRYTKNEYGDPIEQNTLIVLADIPYSNDNWQDVFFGDNDEKYEREWGWDYKPFSLGWDDHYVFCVCPACGKTGIEYEGRGWRVCGSRHKNKDSKTQTYEDEDGMIHHFVYECHGRTDDKGYTYDNKKIINAYKKARQDRFEHGEKPQHTPGGTSNT